MKSFLSPQWKPHRPFIGLLNTALTLALFLMLFYQLRPVVGAAAGAVSIIPVILAGWYFGPAGGVIAASIGLIASIYIANVQGVSLSSILIDANVLFGGVLMLLVGFVFGRLGMLTAKYRQALIDRERSEVEQQSQAKFLALLNDLTRTALEARDLTSLTEILVQRVGELFPTAITYLAIWDERNDLPVIIASRNGEDTPKGLHFTTIDPNLAKVALDAVHAIVVEDSPDPSLRDFETVERLGDCSGLVLPLIAGDQKLGSVIASYDEKHTFSQEEIERGELAAQQIALALTKTRLLENAQQRVSELSGLDEISKTFSVSTDISHTYKKLCKKLVELSGAHLGLIFLCNLEQGRIFAQPQGFGISASIVENLHFHATELDHLCKPIDHRIWWTNLPDKVPTSIKKLGKHRIKSMLVVPLSVDGKRLGVVLLANNPGGFSWADAQKMDIFAPQVAAVIQKAQMFDVTRRQANRQAALLQISTELSGAVDQLVIFQRVVAGIEEHLGFEHVGIFVYDQTTGDRVLSAGNSWPSSMRLPPGRGLSERPLLDGKLHYSPDVHAEPQYISGVGGSEVDVPIWLDGEVMGILFVESPRLDAFQEADFEVLSAAANLIGLALARARSIEAERRQYNELHLLHQVALAATQASTEDELIEQTTQIIGENLYPDNFGIMLLVEDRQILQPHYSYHIADNLTEIDIPLDQGVTGRVATSGLPQRIDDITTVPNYLDVDPRTRSELCVPLKIGKQVLGVINTESSNTAAFSEDDERLLTTLASQLATSIVRLRSVETQQRLFAQMMRTNELISALAHVASLIERAYEPEEVMRLLGQELKRLHMDCMVTLYQAEKQEFAVRYTTFDYRISQLYRRLLGIHMHDLRFDAKRIEPFVNLREHPRPVILDDPVSLIKAALGDLPERYLERILRVTAVALDSIIIHLPLMFEGRLLGVLWLWGENVSEQDIQATSVFANQVAVALENARLFAEVRRLAITDDLTRLYNRRHTYELARIEFSRALRYKRSISAVMIDIDHFKHVNDEYGHQVGDEVLRMIAERIRNILRDVDILGRYGGEEFLLVLPETDAPGALSVAERVRVGIAESPICTEKGDVSLTLSLGVASRNQATHDLETLIARADQALYVSKYKGRNKISLGR